MINVVNTFKFRLMSGDEVFLFQNKICIFKDEKYVPLGLVSKATNNTLEVFRKKGYSIDKCMIRFVVSWKPKDETEKEYAVLLIDINLRKS